MTTVMAQREAGETQSLIWSQTLCVRTVLCLPTAPFDVVSVARQPFPEEVAHHWLYCLSPVGKWMMSVGTSTGKVKTRWEGRGLVGKKRNSLKRLKRQKETEREREKKRGGERDGGRDGRK